MVCEVVVDVEMKKIIVASENNNGAGEIIPVQYMLAAAMLCASRSMGVPTLDVGSSHNNPASNDDLPTRPACASFRSNARHSDHSLRVE